MYTLTSTDGGVGVPLIFTDNDRVFTFEGNGCRPSHQGIGISDEGVMYTMNTTEVHGVMFEPMTYDSHPMDSRVTPAEKVCQTISTRFGGEYDPNTVLVREKVFRKSSRAKSGDDATTWVEADRTNCLNTFDNGENRCAELVVNGGEERMYMVRRITPRECERLQGFPDDYTDIPWNGKEHAPDARRYKALGNSMAVPCMRWIGQRIDWAMANPITEDTSGGVDWQPSLF